MEKVTIGVKQVLQHLKDGMTREEIAKEYGITMSECKSLFKDPRLKGKKTIKKPSFTLVDDATEVEKFDIPNTTENIEVSEEVVNTNDDTRVEKTVEKEGFGEKFLNKKELEEVEEPVEKNLIVPSPTWD